MQDSKTKQERAARGPTAEEFKDVMSTIMADTHTHVELKYPSRLRWAGQVHKAKYSFDNAKIHTSALDGGDAQSLLGQVGFLLSMRVPLSAYSPDQQVINGFSVGSLSSVTTVRCRQMSSCRNGQTCSYGGDSAYASGTTAQLDYKASEIRFF